MKINWRAIAPWRVNRGFSASIQPQIGFTLLENLVVVSIIGLLAAIGTPSWLAFHERMALNKAQDEIYQTLRQAQSLSETSRVRWEVNFREYEGSLQAAIHPVGIPLGEIEWEVLTSQIYIDPTKTTFRFRNGMYIMQFNEMGHVNGQLGRITVKGANNRVARRCVIMSTLLGAMRKEGEGRAGDRQCSTRR
jgi:prepilin-type N-terminal cleavage/methylation domain-containing protein